MRVLAGGDDEKTGATIGCDDNPISDTLVPAFLGVRIDPTGDHGRTAWSENFGRTNLQTLCKRAVTEAAPGFGITLILLKNGRSGEI